MYCIKIKPDSLSGYKLSIPDDLIDRIFPPKKDKDIVENEFINNLDKLKSVIPEQYDCLIDALQFVLSRITNPELVEQDKNEVKDAIDKIKNIADKIKEKFERD